MRTLSVFAQSGRGLTVALVATALLVAALAAFLMMASSAGAVPTVSTDKADYHPDETALISGSGYTPGQLLDIVVIRPDLSIVTGDGTETPGFDTVTADSFGAFTYSYILNGIFGLYTVNVYDNADTLHATVLATTTFEDDAGPAECNGGPTDTSQPGSQYVIDGSSTPPVPTGEVVTSVCIKSGSNTFGTGAHSDLITVDGTYGNDSCYTVSGIGTGTVTITRGATPLCKDISHIDFFTAVAPTPTSTFKVTKTFSDGNAAEVDVTLTCTSPSTISAPNPATTAGQMHTFTITGFTDPGTTCSASESGVPTGYTTDNSACQNLAISDGAQTPCTITNTLNEATFKVTKEFSDGNSAEVDVTLTCTPPSTISAPNPATTVSQMVTFTITGFTDPGTTCSASESGVPIGYASDNSACEDLAISPGVQTSCTITNDPATFKVTKTFSDGNSAEVDVTLNCTSGAITPSSPATTVSQMVTFTITGFTDPGTTCSASESGVPSGYTTDNSACQNLAISDGAQTSCTITNDPATFTVKKDFTNKPGTDTTTVSVTLSCVSATVAAPNPKNASEASPAVFTVTGFTGDPNCTATESPIPAGYTSTGVCSAALLAVGQCTITNTPVEPPMGGLVEMVIGSDDSGASGGWMGSVLVAFLLAGTTAGGTLAVARVRHRA